MLFPMMHILDTERVWAARSFFILYKTKTNLYHLTGCYLVGHVSFIQIHNINQALKVLKQVLEGHTVT